MYLRNIFLYIISGKNSKKKVLDVLSSVTKELVDVSNIIWPKEGVTVNNTAQATTTTKTKVS